MNTVACKEAVQDVFQKIRTEADLITIDSVIDDYATKLDDTCMKTDVQGYEDQVLQGAQYALQKIRALKLELSLVSLYEDDKLYPH